MGDVASEYGKHAAAVTADAAKMAAKAAREGATVAANTAREGATVAAEAARGPLIQLLGQVIKGGKIVTTLFDVICEEHKLKPWQIGLGTLAAAYNASLYTEAIIERYGILTDELPVHKQIMLGVFKIAGKLPFVASYKAKELKKVQESFQHDMIKHPAGYKVNKTLPAVGLSKELLFEQLSQLAGVGEPEARLNAGKAYTEMLTQVYGKFAWSNPLHPTVFPGVRQMESEVVRMTLGQ
eukprot:gene24592-20435_t